ncbi:hypothetical protein Aph01nite_03310 [Acrocarpospora phusangensis]|uniref:Uncharacterized protein n=1 Tax=Acrocarpospora phusangensis TaxID=1070424 RepID=A0A919UHX1_9ACTN|nr:hypothetical protein Aph01nite_03310 [Acrocarpospora phusangensis]
MLTLRDHSDRTRCPASGAHHCQQDPPDAPFIEFCAQFMVDIFRMSIQSTGDTTESIVVIKCQPALDLHRPQLGQSEFKEW